MQKIPCLLAVAWLALGGCGGAGELRLVVSLPDDSARQLTRFIRVVAVEPAGESESCAALLDGSAVPGAVGYAIEQELEFAYPVTSQVEPLRDVGPGRRLFYAEGLDADQRRLLHGCTDQEAGGGGPGEVAVALGWVEECEPTNGGQETCDGLDNDCDQQTDEGAPEALCQARDHADPLACTAGACGWTCQADWWNADGDWSDGCECQRTLGGVEWCDGVDNDCDGTVDGASCQRCTIDADCAAAGGPCLRATCDQGVCETEPLGQGSGCDDGDRCTQADTCDAQGTCAGSPRVCSDGIDCTDDACDPTDGQCKATVQEGVCLVGVSCHTTGYRPIADGCLVCDPAVDPAALTLRPELCDNGQYCDGLESCQADGTCTAGAPACAIQCSSECDEDLDRCVSSQPGEGCDDGVRCTQGDACDGEGGCVGTPDDGQCGWNGLCSPGCSTDESGCAYAPAQLEVACDQEVPLDTASLCRLNSAGTPLVAGCLGCRVAEQLPVWFADGRPDPNGANGCELTGWSLLADVCSQVMSATCPLALQTGACCQQPSCQQSPPDGEYAVVLNGGACGGEGLAFARTVSLGGYSQVFVCFQLGLNDLGPAGWGIQVEAIDPASGSRAASDCLGDLTGRFLESLDYCLAVPPAALTWDSAQVVLRLQPPDSGEQLYLRSVRLLGMPLTCPAPTPVVQTEFSGCDGQMITSYPPWEIQSGALCGLPLAGGVCAERGGLLVGDGAPLLPQVETFLDMYTEVDLSPDGQGASLCWVRTFFGQFAARPMGQMEVLASSQAGTTTVYRENFSTSNQADVCELVCVDLDAHGAKHSGQQSVQIHFSVDVNDGVMGLNHITLSGLGRCPADGNIAVGPVAEYLDPDGATVLAAPVSDLAAGPVHPVVQCDFLDLASGEDDFRFVLP
ncbi:MAG TPA: hypothetical protein PK668_28115 [Myxococcota bacterium]|nr:hypothetical protein [Myxococcota bacterium]HRY97375.1 hypothetical protein [Myxococcota bacterium]HSA23340.1 hypothetical protein [Myxococcota bacterium]